MKFHCKNCCGTDLIELLRKIISDQEMIIEDEGTIINLFQEEIEVTTEFKITSIYTEISRNTSNHL